MKNRSSIHINTWVILLIIILASLTRLLPHAYNFSVLGAIGLFGGAYFHKRSLGVLVPLAIAWISDLVINNIVYAHTSESFIWFYKGFYWQYACYIIIALLGISMRNKVSLTKLFTHSLSAVGIFFIISNFGVWLGSATYPQTLSGLSACYLAGVPFLKQTLISQFIYTGALFGLYYLAQQKITALKNVSS